MAQQLRFDLIANTKGFSGPITAAGTLIVTAFAASIKVAAKFEKQLSKLRGISGATEKEMGQLSNQARNLGKSTAYTAIQVAQAQTELAKLGFTTNEILHGSGGVLNLAAGLGVELSEAAALTGSTLRQFGLEASKTGKVVDILAKSATESGLDFESLKESLKLVGPIAGSVGISIEETVGILETLADSGLKGSIAGTALRKSFIELNAAGIPLKEALDNVRNSSDQLGTAVDLVGKRAATAFVVLAKNGYTAVSDFDGVANELRETMEDNLIGDFTKLTSAITDLGISAGNTSTGALRDLVQLLTGGASGLSDKLSFADLITKINTEAKKLDTKKFESAADAMRRILAPNLTGKGTELLGQFDTITGGLTQLGESADYINGKAFTGVSTFFDQFGIDISDTNGNIEQIQAKLPDVLRGILAFQKLSSDGGGATPLDLTGRVNVDDLEVSGAGYETEVFSKWANDLPPLITGLEGTSVAVDTLETAFGDLSKFKFPTEIIDDVEVMDESFGDAEEDLDILIEAMAKFGDQAQEARDEVGKFVNELEFMTLASDTTFSALSNGFNSLINDMIKELDLGETVMGRFAESILSTIGGVLAQLAAKFLTQALFGKAISKLQVSTQQAVANAAGLTAAAIAASASGPAFPLVYPGLAAANLGIVNGTFAPLLALEKGGIATGPTTAIIGESGPEAVVPLSGSNFNRFMDGGGKMPTNFKLTTDFDLQTLRYALQVADDNLENYS